MFFYLMGLPKRQQDIVALREGDEHHDGPHDNRDASACLGTTKEVKTEREPHEDEKRPHEDDYEP